MKKFLVMTLIIALIFPLFSGQTGADSDPVIRISGSDRYATAVEVSQEGWTSSAEVVIARGDDYADALAGVPLAYRLGAPILLVEPNRLPSVTRQELIRLGASQVIILGGTGAISTSVANSLKGLGLEVERIAGSDRFDTAARIASRVSPYGTQGVVVANGRNFPDALAAAPYAAVAGYPVLLVERNSIPAVVTNAIRGLGASEAIVVGGTSVVSSSTLSKLPGAHRISGSDRYATAVALAKHFNPLGEDCFVATGRDFADAITGAVLAARRESGILLVGTSLPSVVRNYFSDNEIKQVCILGGVGAVSLSVYNAIRNVLIPPGETGTTGVVGWTTPGASVKVAGKSVVAEEDGSYKISGIASGEHTAVFNLDGYRTESVSVNVTAQQHSVLNVDLAALNPDDICLRGAVVEKTTGRPMVGAEVAVEILSPQGKWIQEAVLRTNTKGIYSLANSAGDDGEAGTTVRNVLRFGARVRLTIRQDVDDNFQGGYHPVVVNIDLKRDKVVNIVDGVEMTKVKELTITGRVTDPDGAVVSSEDVTLFYGDRSIVASTNEQGDYSLENKTLPSGKYVISVDYGEENDYAIYTREVSIAEGRDLTHNIKLVQGYNVNVEVNSAKNGETFEPGADYYALLLQGGAEITTDPAQIINDDEVLSFTWSRIAPGSYTVRIRGDYVLTKTFSIRVYNSEFSSTNQRVTRAGAIDGTVMTEEDSLILEGARVELLNTSGKIVDTVETDEDGKYCFGGLAGGGKYTVRASMPGYRTRTAQDQLLVQVNKSTEQNFTLPVLPAIAEVSGRVYTTSTLMPATGANLIFRALDVHEVPRGSVVKSAEVNSEGNYLVKLKPGAYTVVITDPGNHETLETTLAVAAGDELKNHNFKLQTGGNASLTVTVRNSLHKVIDNVVLTDKWGDEVDGNFRDGKTVYAELSAGTYTVTARGSSHETLKQTVAVTKGAKITKSFTLIPSSKVQDVDFWIVGEYNQSLNDVRVIIMSGTEVVANGLTTKGKLPARLPAGSYKALIYADGYILDQVEFNVANQDIVIPVIRLDKW